MLSPDSDPAPTYISTDIARSQLAVYLSPYKAFSISAAIPLMIGEWGWVPSAGGELAWIADHRAAWADAGTVIQMYWNYDQTTDTSANPWAARPGGGNTWRPSIVSWLSDP